MPLSMIHRRSTPLAYLSIALSLAFTSVTRADVKLHDMFSDEMVLQRGMNVPIWGKANPGEKITITVGDETDLRSASGVAAADGSWRIDLPKMEAGGPFEVKVVGKNTITLRDVLIGDVWVCSGQSNMEWGLNSSSTGADAIQNALLPKLRLLTIPRSTSGTPQRDLPRVATDKPGVLAPPRWVTSSPKTAPGFSAVAFFFGRQLLKDHDVPIGLIHTSWGGTPAQAWTSREGLTAVPSLRPLALAMQTSGEQWVAALDKYSADVAKWVEAVKKAETQGIAAPPAPVMPPDPRGGSHTPTVLYNAMISPVVPFAIKGAIWYQGESNAGNAAQYRELFPAMIRDWRANWKQGEFPFLFVQLANYMAPQTQPSEGGWAELREAQLMTLSLPNTGMALAIDIGDAKDIHPRNKEEVGRRLELAARAVAYGEKLIYSGPIYESMTVEGGAIRLQFKHTGGGLVIGGPNPGDKLRGFAIAGKDGVFEWADAAIDGQTVVLKSAKVPAPTTARYGWANNPDGNLYNKEGLPASPFRTDAPVVTK